MTTPPIRTAVITGSTRVGRFGDVVAGWVAREASERPDLSVDPIDLADIALPQHYPAERDPAVQAYVDRIAAADAFVIVTPEYNHSFPAILKQAIDLPYEEWRAKPVAFVSYGGLAGGLRAVEHLRQVFPEVHAVTMRDTVSFHMVRNQFGADGNPLDVAGTSGALKVMLDQLAWWALALRDARSVRPYGR